jgi:hypothetical protein
MKRVVLLIFIMYLFSMALNNDNIRIQNIVPYDNQSVVQNKAQMTNSIPWNETSLPLIGYTIVVGYTTYDWQFNGPLLKWCATDTIAHGIHVVWMWYHFSPTIRNMYYNFYNYINHSCDTTGGTSIYTNRGSYGNLDNDPITGVVVTCTFQTIGGLLTPVGARDQAPGAGIFEYCIGPSGYYWPIAAVTNNRAIHFVMLTNLTEPESLWYARIQPWCNWSLPVNILPSPMVPNVNISSSHISNKVLILWTTFGSPIQESAYYRLSNDGGLTWETAVQIPYPPAFQGIAGTLPTFNITGLYAMFDHNDNFHIVTTVNDTGYVIPSEIWHYCPTNNPSWSLVHQYNPDTFVAAVGYNAVGCDRPTIVENTSDNYLYVAWEQFDSLNYEPQTSLARADIFVAKSPNNGMTWQNQVPITTPNTTSKRFPCAAGVDHDTLTVAYLIDSIAGFEIMSQGRATYNPVVIHRLKVPLLVAGAREQVTSKMIDNKINIYPNPARGFFTIRVPQSADRSEIKIFDVMGKVIKEIATPSARNDNIVRVSLEDIKDGVYFIKAGDQTRKIVVNK